MASLQGQPDLNGLYETASAQAGLFTTAQAFAAGYSPQLLNHYVKIERFARVRRGVYRLVHFPPTDHEDLAGIWLWSERLGVFSHDTALAMHDLSDILPAQVHMTLPAAWRARRLRVPMGVTLHCADVPAADRTWSGPVPITSVLRTLVDCARAELAPDLLRQAALQAILRGLVARADLDIVASVLAPFGGLPE